MPHLRTKSFYSLFTLLSLCHGQITLPGGVPTSGCIGGPAGTATFSSSVQVASQVTINAGDYWKQTGAVWNFSLATDGFTFGAPGIPGFGAGFGGSNDIPQAAEDALKLSNDKRTVQLLVPSTNPGGAGEWQIIWAIQNSAEAATQAPSQTPAPSPSWSSGACSLSTFTDKAITCSGSVQTPLVPTTTVCACPSNILLDTLSGGDTPCGDYISAQGDLEVVTNYCTSSPPAKVRRSEATITPAPELRGAKFRPRPRNLEQRADGDPSINIDAAWPCLGPSSSKASGNADIASLCSNNQITAGASAWTTYEASSYLSSIITANQGPRATPQPPVNGIAILHSDVNPPGAQCTYTSKCDSISCSDVKDYNSGTEVSIQRFLGYQSVVNLNNYFNAIYTAVFDAGTIASLLDAKIVTTFYTNPKPPVTWDKIMGMFTPLLGMVSAMLGPFSAIGSAVAGVAGGIVGSVVAGAGTNVAPVADKRFDEYADIGDYIGHYLEATNAGISSAFDETIGKNTAIFEWTGSPVGGPAHGIFGDGFFSDADYTQNLNNDLLEKTIRIFTYKAINFGWVDSGCFIVYVPYGRDVKGPDGKMITGGINEDYCNNDLKNKDAGALIVCNAPGGMAYLLNAAGGQDSGKYTTPQGYDQSFQVLPNEAFSVQDAISGSVNSWKEGDFGYDAANPYQDAFNSDGGLSDDQVEAISKIAIGETTAGFFNIPVCQTWDLRYFPPASGNSCTGCGSAIALGGTQGSTKKFMDNVNDVVKDTMQKAGATYCGGYYGTSCSNPCPDDIYTG